MRLLLDTHAAIWALTEPQRFPARVAQAILEADAVFVSAASVWEIAIKFGIGRRTAPPFSGSDALRHFKEAGFLLLPVSAAHAAASETLPALHADPFDRLILAQAFHEPLRLVSADRDVARYSDAIMTW